MARIKIADMQVGNSYETALAVVSSSARTTRAGKPYLVMSLYDGVDTITCNYWNWAGKSMPESNKVYDFKVDCSEYNGNKQLTCKAVHANTTDMLEDFMPQGTADVAQAYKDFYELISNIDDDFFREVGLCIAEEARDYWLHVPGANSIHHNFMGGTLVHSLSVGKLSKAMAEQIDGAWVDLATIGGLLHDVGKLFTYSLEGLTISYTEEGQLFDHLFIGAEFVGNMASPFIRSDMDELKLQMLRHIILSHHMRKEYGSTVTPKCIEAWIVSHCDDMDAKAEMIRVASRKAGDKCRWTDKIWGADNQPHFTVQAIAALSKKQHIMSTAEAMGIADDLDVVKAW